MKPYDILIIGAGAAGLIAAGRAGELGAKVMVVERNRVAGRKLLITGKGRCNITNDAPWDGYKENIFPEWRFFRQAFNQLGPKEVVEHFHQLGLSTKVERGGRIFPESDKSADVVNTLLQWAQRNRVEFLYDQKVTKLLIENGSIKGVEVQTGNTVKSLFAHNIILASGGKSYPATGSDGNGYRLAQIAGHSTTPLNAALVPLETACTTAAKLQGLSLKNVTATLWINGKKAATEFGEMLFTHFGLSGPIILTISRKAVLSLREGNNVEISIDLKPALDEKKLDTRLLRDLNENGRKLLGNIARMWLPASLGEVVLDLAGISPELEGNKIDSPARKKLLFLMKNLRFQISGHRQFKEAIITAGGVNLKEIDPRTMQSKLTKNLFFAGEILDLDANTGGFNLQIAWSTGWAAAEAAVGNLEPTQTAI
ncbi:MAG TPA: aminoacetone oxidase family FAD-binding enzyme [Bacteroidales bacterium]|nr:aminoacetone oxidase family FAD-binding enzyme [Bacteroidales bacterium]